MMEKKVKQIVFIVGNYKNGGVPMHATNLANEMGARGHQVTILVTKEKSEDLFFELHKNVEIVVLDEYYSSHKEEKKILIDKKRQQKRIKAYKRLRYISKYFPSIDKAIDRKIRGIRRSELLRSYLIQKDRAILIPFGITYFENTFYANIGLSNRIIYAERNAPQEEFKDVEDQLDFYFSMLKRANGAVMQTQDELSFYGNVLKRNVSVIHNPIKQNLIKPYTGIRRPVIVNFCRIAEQKNLKLLIDAFNVFLKSHQNFELHIYGNTVEPHEERLREELKEYVMKMGLTDKVYIFPPAADVHSRVVDCSMFVSSSDFEGLSNSMIEAMAIGLPCVCTDCLGGGAREVIQSGVNGLIVPCKNKEMLCDGMKRMVEDENFARNCGFEASKIRDDQSVEKIVDQWMKVIENV